MINSIEMPLVLYVLGHLESLLHIHLRTMMLLFYNLMKYICLCDVFKDRLRNYYSLFLYDQAQRLCICLDLINTRGFISKTKFFD